MAMSSEEKQMFLELKEKVDKIDNYTSNLGGSLEFKTLVQRYITGVGGVFQVDGTFKHTGTKLGFFGATPVSRQSNIESPTGQTNDLDSEARSKINEIISVLDAYGLTQ